MKGTESLTCAREGIRTPNLLIRRMKCVDAFCIQTFQPLVSLLTHTHKVTRSIRGPALRSNGATKPLDILNSWNEEVSTWLVWGRIRRTSCGLWEYSIVNFRRPSQTHRVRELFEIVYRSIKHSSREQHQQPATSLWHYFEIQI